jgi:hypothetical protein
MQDPTKETRHSVREWHSVQGRDAPRIREGTVSVNILGGLPPPLDTIVRKVLHRELDSRPQAVVVEISRQHGDIVVHLLEPFDKRLKFSQAAEGEIGRELSAILSDIVDEEFGPAQ